MSITAMKQALEALLSAEAEMNCEYGATELLRQAIEQAEKQEPVGWYFKGLTNRGVSLIKENDDWIPLYTVPQPQREWVGLTADEMEGLYESCTYMDETDYIHMLMLAEEKLKEKNHDVR